MLELTSQGIFELEFSYNKETSRKCVKKQDIFHVLRDSLQIAQGTTFGDFFRVVDQYKNLKRFLAKYSGCPYLEEFHAQALEPMRSENRQPIKYLEIGWAVEFIRWNEEVEGSVQKVSKTNFSMYPTFYGIDSDKPDTEYEAYGVSYTPMYDLVDLPLILNKQVKIKKPWMRGDSQEVLIFESETDFTLLDVLNAVYDDISFMGGPKENRQHMELIDNIEEQIQETMGDIIPLNLNVPE